MDTTQLQAAHHALTQTTRLPIRSYSTFDFGRERDEANVSVVAPDNQAEALMLKLRPLLPPGLVAFAGTSRWLGHERHQGVEVVIGKGQSQFDILRLARSNAANFDMETEDLISKLQDFDARFGIDIRSATTDTIEFELIKSPSDAGAFADEIYEFCPDIVDQGCGSVEVLAQGIDVTGRVYLWWD